MAGQERKLRDLAGVGRATLADLEKLQITTVEALAGADPDWLYERLCEITGERHDVCCLDVFRCAVAQAKDPALPAAQRNWWWWSRVRKSAC